MSRPLNRVPLLVLICLLLTVTAMLSKNAIPSHATSSSITLSPMYGPPTSGIQIQGKGFKSGETITLTFDTTQVGQAKASLSGTFSTKISVPSAAVPGSHLIKCKGNTSGLLAQALFQVRTDWVQLGFNRTHTSFNVSENVLNPTNTPNLTQYWRASIDTCGRLAESSDANPGLSPPWSNFQPKNVWLKVRPHFGEGFSGSSEEGCFFGSLAFLPFSFGLSCSSSDSCFSCSSLKRLFSASMIWILSRRRVSNQRQE